MSTMEELESLAARESTNCKQSVEASNVFVRTMLAQLADRLGCDEEQFSRVDIAKDCPATLDARAVKNGYLTEKGYHFAFRISLSHFDTEFRWSAKLIEESTYIVDFGVGKGSENISLRKPEAMIALTRYVETEMRKRIKRHYALGRP